MPVLSLQVGAPCRKPAQLGPAFRATWHAASRPSGVCSAMRQVPGASRSRLKLVKKHTSPVGGTSRAVNPELGAENAVFRPGPGSRLTGVHSQRKLIEHFGALPANILNETFEVAVLVTGAGGAAPPPPTPPPP